MEKLSKEDMEIIAKVTGYELEELEGFVDEGYGRIFSSFEEFVKWYFDDNENYAVEMITEWHMNLDVPLFEPQKFFESEFRAIKLTGEKYAYAYE